MEFVHFEANLRLQWKDGKRIVEHDTQVRSMFPSALILLH